MGIAGSGSPPHALFRQALDAGNLTRSLNIARLTPNVSLTDALRIVELLALEDDPRYDAAARRWISRYAAEGRAATRRNVHRAADLLVVLPDSPASIRGLRHLIDDAAASCRR